MALGVATTYDCAALGYTVFGGLPVAICPDHSMRTEIVRYDGCCRKPLFGDARPRQALNPGSRPKVSRPETM